MPNAVAPVTNPIQPDDYDWRSRYKSARTLIESTFAPTERSAALTRRLIVTPPVSRGVYTPRLSATVLDTLETTVIESTVLSSPERRAHTANTCNALEAAATDSQQLERVQRIRDCGTVWLVALGDDGEYLLTRRCHERLCPECQRVRARKYQQHYETMIKRWRHPKLLTLTLKGNTDCPSDRLTEIINKFRRLRSMALWKQCVRGGYYVVETTHNAVTNNWHVHLHILMDAKYIDKEWLHNTWQSITGDSFMTSIKCADVGSARYLAKYIAKPSKVDGSDVDPWWLYEQFRGRRMAQGFGDVPPINDVVEDRGEPHIIATFSEVLDRALNGDAEAEAIIARLTFRYGKRLPDDPRKRE